MPIRSREEIMHDIEENLATLNPNVLSEYRIMLSAHLSRLGEQHAEAQRVYYQKWVSIRDRVETDGQADKRAKATEEYYNLSRLNMAIKGTGKMINVLRGRIEVLTNETRNVC